MNTPAHVFLAAALTAKPNDSARNWVMMAGALIPDLMMFVMVAWERWINGLSAREIFGTAYFSDFWQKIFAITNSMPIYAGLILAGLALRMNWLWVFGLCAFLHGALDFPLHHSDGHPHFWPFTDWIYQSPVSYWNPAHYGLAASYTEALFCIILCILLWRRFAGWPARALIAAGLAIELLFSVGSSVIYG